MKLVAIKDVPPGSLSLSSSSNEVLFRFPDGTGWRHSEISRDKGWGWDEAATVRLVVLLTGLSVLEARARRRGLWYTCAADLPDCAR